MSTQAAAGPEREVSRMGVWLALVAALSYGVGDFVGGVGVDAPSRR